MDEHVSDRCVMVTGAGSGIGRATALRFARDGAGTIVLIDKEEDRIRLVGGEVEALGCHAELSCVDVADTIAMMTAIEEVLKKVPRVDVLVSNAAAWTKMPFLDTPLEAWIRVVQTNVTASFVLGQRIARAMVASGGGVILYTASISALGANRGFAPYCTSKGAIVSLMRSMAVELAPYAIRVNAVSPGPTDTQMGIDGLGEERMARMRQSMPGIPMGRMATSDEIAAVFAFLASEDASYVTGHNIVVDGALTAQVYDAPE